MANIQVAAIAAPGGENAAPHYDRREWRAEMADVRREVRAGLDLTQFEGPDPVGSAALATGSILAIITSAALVAMVWTAAGAAAASVAYLASVVVIARQQRVLELLVHDGSHGAFARSRMLGDLLCNLLAGAPVMQLVASYRRTHKIHHQQFGSDRDPCRDRTYMAQPAASGVWPAIVAIAKGLPRYMADYYGSVTSTSWRPVLAALAWHGTVVGTAAAFVGLGTAAVGWVLFWAVPFATVLPVIRMVAESDEHDYGKRSEASGTFSNFGPVNTAIVHPGNDQFHLAHHAFAAIPMRRLRRFDRMARRVSPLYAAMPIRTR